MAALQDLTQPQAGDLIAWIFLDRLPVEQDLAADTLRADKTGYCAQRRLAGAVGADQGDDLPLLNIEGNALDRLNAAVIDIQIADGKNLTQRRSPPDMPQ